MANGLIDGLGNLDVAIREAAALAGVAPEATLNVVHLPEPQDLIASIFGGGSDGDEPVAAAVRWAIYRQMRTEALETQRLLQLEATLPQFGR